MYVYVYVQNVLKTLTLSETNNVNKGRSTFCTYHCKDLYLSMFLNTRLSNKFNIYLSETIIKY